MSYAVSEKSYLLSEIARSNFTWPLPCIVEDGFYGNTLWDTVSSGETILLSALQKRRRVLARISDQSYYSIPHDYPLRFSAVLSNQKETKPKLISEILVKHQLPVTLKVQHDHSALQSIQGHKVLLPADQIIVTGSYDEKYVVGHCIVKDVLQNEILLLPTFLKIRVRLIEGAENTSDTKWKAIQKTWREESQRNAKNPTLPPLNIVVFESLPPEIESSGQKQNSSEIYETLEPSAYIALDFNSEKSESNEYTVVYGGISSLPGDETVLKSDKTVSRQVTNSGALSEFHGELQDAVFTRKLSSSLKVTTTTGAGTQIQINPEGSRIPPQPPRKLSKSFSQENPQSNVRPPPKPPSEQCFDDVSQDSKIEPRTNSRIRSLKDVPTSLKSLNCDEIADCLRLLKMSKYSEQFIDNQIDGSLLEELQESILTEELHMTQMHAKKLIMFAQKGWRPT